MNAPEGEETIFAEALRLPPEQRAAYLAQATRGNAELRRRVESLLGSYGTGDFLERSAAPELRKPLSVSVSVTERPGDTIGRYKLREQIGEGGCGIVYVAEQTEPVRRRLALKIIKLGMDTRSVIARFEAERQALALMDHPNIAKVFDAGTTETGRPYFVMELVRGMKITEYCDEKKLSTRARLDLFIQVCQAIQHAHQKGIIHRDIKPSNILVTVNDGVPVPKVIDFGVAKATSGQQLTDKTIYTAFEQFIGTPAYMSPEQAVLTSLDIDTRSDIYALGVLLYELLTGKTPFDGKELLAIGLDEMRRTIREQEPPRPSTRLSTLPGQELSTTAQRRGLDAPKLVSELRGDLDWIVMKALEKDRARRYETANGLARDIQRHLNHEPVVACPPSRLYRLNKTVRRNKLAFSAAASVVAALTIGLAISTWRFVKEREALKRAVAAEQAAKEEKDSAEDVLKFVRDKVLAAGRPEGIGGGVGKDVTMRQAIDAAESKIAKAFTNRPLVEAAIRKTLGESYLYLGEPLLAIPQLERALAIRREGLGIENEHTVGTMTKLREAYQDAGKPFEFLPFYEEALKLTKARRGPVHGDTLMRMDDLALAYREAGKFDAAIALFGELLKLQKAKRGPKHPETLTVMNNLAAAYSTAGKLDQALPLLEETLKLRKAQWAPDHPETLTVMNNLAMTYKNAEKLDHALPLFEETLKLRKAQSGPDHAETLRVMNQFAGACADARKLDQAIALYEEALKLHTAKLGAEHPDTLTVMHHLASAYQNAGKLDQAIALCEETLKLRKATLGPEHRETLTAMNNLAWAYSKARKFDQALPLYEETLKLRKATLRWDHPETLTVMQNLGEAYGESGKLDAAIALLEETLILRKAKLGPEHSSTDWTMHHLAWMYVKARKFDQAVPLYEEALKLRKAALGPEHPDTFTSMFNLAMAYKDAGKLDQALPLFEERLKLQKAKLGPEHPETLASMNDLGLAYRDSGKLDKAIPLLEEAFSQSKAKLGPEHPDTSTLNVMRTLAVAYRDSGQLDHALPLFQVLLKLNTAVRGPNDPETRLTTEGLAKTLRKAGNLEQLEAMYREQLAQQSGDVLAVRFELGRLLLENDKTNSADSRRREELGSEGERLVREYLADARSRYTNDPLKLAGKLADVAEFHYRQGNYTDAAPLYREIVQSRRSRLSEAHKDVLEPKASLARVLSDWAWAERTNVVAADVRRLTSSNSEPSTSTPQKTDQSLVTSAATTPHERAREAERLLREVLAVRLRDSTNSWRIGDVKSRLGGALVSAAVTDSTMDAESRPAKLTEAESLLLEGCERVQGGATDDKYKRDALQRLVRLYEAWNKPDKRVEWQQKLELFDKAQEKSSASESSATNNPPQAKLETK